MKKSQKFTDLIVWKKGHQLVLEIYKISANFPKCELYGLTSQIRRTDVSITANISEGFVKRSNRDKLRFYNILQGSLEELKYYLILAQDLNYCKSDNLLYEAEEVSRLLSGYIKGILTAD